MSPEHLAILSMIGTVINFVVAFAAIRRHCNDDKEREVRDRVRSEMNTERIESLERRQGSER